MFQIRLFIIEGKEISKEGITPEDLTAMASHASGVTSLLKFVFTPAEFKSSSVC